MMGGNTNCGKLWRDGRLKRCGPRSSCEGQVHTVFDVGVTCVALEELVGMPTTYKSDLVTHQSFL